MLKLDEFRFAGMLEFFLASMVFASLTFQKLESYGEIKTSWKIMDSADEIKGRAKMLGCYEYPQ